MEKVREHLAAELEVEPAEIADATRFKEDLDADSLDLYELVMELEDSYGITVSEEEAARIETVGDAVDFVVERLPGLAMARGIRRLGRGGRGAAPSAETVSRARALRGCSTALPLTCAARRSPTPPGSSTAPTPTAGSPSSATASSAWRSPSTCSAAIRAPTSAG